MLSTKDIVQINLSVNEAVETTVSYDTGLIIGTSDTLG